MKPNALLIAILMFFVTTQVNAAERLKNNNRFPDLHGYLYILDYLKTQTNPKSSLGGRLSLKTESEIIDNIVSYAGLRAEITIFNSDMVVDNHHAFAGFRFEQLGSLDYGKNDGVLKAISYYTDVLPEFGGDVQNYTILGGYIGSALTYHNRNFFDMIDGLDFSFQYADKNSKKFLADSSVTHEAYGFNWQYIIGNSGFTVGSGYAKAGNDNSYLLGMVYHANNFYLSSIYAQSIIGSIQYTGHENVFGYELDFEAGHLTLLSAYISHQTETSNKVKYLDFGAQYDLNKNISFIFDYKFDLINQVNDRAILGVIYYL